MSLGDYDDDDEIEIHAGHGEPWLVSYADLMTLLFGFFVLMYTFASKNRLDENYVKIKKELAQYFGGSFVDEFEIVGRNIGVELKSELPNDGNFELKSGPEGLEISLGTSSLFPLGGTRLTRQAEESIRKMAKILRDEFQDEIIVVVSGHSDDAPIRTKTFPSNWELSAHRSAAVVRLFEEQGMDRTQLKVEGLADSRPLVPNRDASNRPIPDNRARNRRVVINVYKVRGKIKSK